MEVCCQLCLVPCYMLQSCDPTTLRHCCAGSSAWANCCDGLSEKNETSKEAYNVPPVQDMSRIELIF